VCRVDADTDALSPPAPPGDVALSAAACEGVAIGVDMKDIKSCTTGRAVIMLARRDLVGVAMPGTPAAPAAAAASSLGDSDAAASAARSSSGECSRALTFVNCP
jgi:hypothetical protein